jgi:hypothetical protein
LAIETSPMMPRTYPGYQALSDRGVFSIVISSARGAAYYRDSESAAFLEPGKRKVRLGRSLKPTAPPRVVSLRYKIGVARDD